MRSALQASTSEKYIVLDFSFQKNPKHSLYVGEFAEKLLCKINQV